MDETVLLRFRVREPATHRNGPERGSVVRRTVRTMGEVMITFGLVLLLFAAYEIWGKSIIVSEHQHQLDSQLNQQWAQPPAGTGHSNIPVNPPPGDSIARIYIPRLSNHWVVVEGVSQADIAYAPGHYPGTAMPGQIGNFSVAGHRTPAIWWDLDEVRDGDLVIVQTRTGYFIYTVTSIEIVKPTAIQVVAPVPDHPGETPTQAMLTLTTCNPKWDNYQRLIVHGTLTSTRSNAHGAPPEIKGS
jgi:LPXTG-site transpeptidase (sortase) family protein